MRIEALKHMAGVALAITRGGRIIVFGSSSLLGTVPDADQRFELIRRSLDADFSTPMTEAWIVRTDAKLREAAEKGGKPLPR